MASVRRVRFLLDENLPPRVGELMAAMGFPMLWVGGPGPPATGSSDVEHCRWCGAEGVVWTTVDRGLLKDREIFNAVVAHRTSVLLLPGRGINLRGYLLLIVLGLERQGWEKEFGEVSEPVRCRAGKTGRLTRISMSPPSKGRAARGAPLGPPS